MWAVIKVTPLSSISPLCHWGNILTLMAVEPVKVGCLVLASLRAAEWFRIPLVAEGEHSGVYSEASLEGVRLGADTRLTGRQTRGCFSVAPRPQQTRLETSTGAFISSPTLSCFRAAVSEF